MLVRRKLKVQRETIATQPIIIPKNELVEIIDFIIVHNKEIAQRIMFIAHWLFIVGVITFKFRDTS